MSLLPPRKMLPKSILEHTAVISHPVRKIAFMSVQIAQLRYLWRTLPFPRAFRRTVDRYYLYPRLKHISRVTAERIGSPSIVGFLQSGLGIGEAARQEALALSPVALLEAFLPWLSISPARPTEAFPREHSCERQGEPS